MGDMARSEPLLTAKPLLRAMALQCAEPYCEKYGLSVEKLKDQKFEVILDEIFFAQPTGVKPDGLRNDLATVPYPTLIMRLDEDGNIRFHRPVARGAVFVWHGRCFFCAKRPEKARGWRQRD